MGLRGFARLGVIPRSAQFVPAYAIVKRFAYKSENSLSLLKKSNCIECVQVDILKRSFLELAWGRIGVIPTNRGEKMSFLDGTNRKEMNIQRCCVLPENL